MDSTSGNGKPESASMFSQFQQALAASKHVVVLTGAGVSAESGIPTFRGAGGLWRKWDAMQLATPSAFVRDPSLVWEFYHYRREVVSRCKPNPGHYALAAHERAVTSAGKKFTLLTQNIDRLHQAAGSKNILELHGSLWDVCVATKSGLKDKRKPPWENRQQPLVPALAGKGEPDITAGNADIPVNELPHDADGSLLRPAVVWFNENLDSKVLEATSAALDSCDFFMTVGTSSAVYPAAGFAAEVAQRGVPVAEFNLDTTAATGLCDYVFQGKSGELLPVALEVQDEVAKLIAAQQRG